MFYGKCTEQLGFFTTTTSSSDCYNSNENTLKEKPQYCAFLPHFSVETYTVAPPLSKTKQDGNTTVQQESI